MCEHSHLNVNNALGFWIKKKSKKKQQYDNSEIGMNISDDDISSDGGALDHTTKLCGCNRHNEQIF